MREKIYSGVLSYYKQNPLRCILLTAALLRMVAAIFSRGYGMHDDHFLVIESAGSIADGYDAMDWLPGNSSGRGPQGHTVFYWGLHYVLFSILNFLGITSPEVKMYIVRGLNAFFSLSVVWFGYKIASKYAHPKVARQIGWLLAAFWFMPWLSVRSLVEIHCIPFLMWGLWFYVKNDEVSKKHVILSGLIMGIAFSVRYQTIFFLGGFGLALLLLKQYKNAIIWGASAIFSMFVIQAIPDYLIWGTPFAELYEYVRYNLADSGAYPQGGFFKFFIVILGMLIPPVSVFIFGGFFVRWKRYLLLFLPSFAFLLFHSFFPNKQERFIFTIVPFVILLGMIGWDEWKNSRTIPNGWQKFIKASWIFFAIVNTILLVSVSFHYSKKTRVEAMLYLSEYPNKEVILCEKRLPKMPRFYLGDWETKLYAFDERNIAQFLSEKPKFEGEPQFVIMKKTDYVQPAIDSLKSVYPDLIFAAEITPSFVDDLLYKINPKNANEFWVIFRNEKYYPEKTPE